MPEFTQNYGLVKPKRNEGYNVELFNQNAEKIDENMMELDTRVTTQLAQKVEKVAGKQLSTNDYTTAEKNKLAGIVTATQAEAEAGTANNRYMTPQGTAQAIAKLRQIIAGQGDPRGTVSAGLGAFYRDDDSTNLDWYFKATASGSSGWRKMAFDIFAIASQAEAEAGAANDKYMTPQRTAQAIAKMSADFNHVRNGSGNPNGVIEGRIGWLYRDELTLQMYIKTTNTGKTGWEAIITEAETGSGNPNGVVQAPMGAMYKDTDNGQIFVKSTPITDFFGWWVLGPHSYSGQGNPEGIVTAPLGAVYRDDDDTILRMYIKTLVTGKTGWRALMVDTVLAGNGHPEGVVSALLGVSYRDNLTGKMYYKTMAGGNGGWKEMAFI